MNVNKHGLARTIPSDIKRKIRQNSGFGCVVCGLGITEYEHVDPEFHDAKTHDPSAMTLLCPMCHTKVTKGLLSKKRIQAAMLDPFCLRQGFSNEEYDFMNMHPIVILGSLQIEGSKTPMYFKGKNVLQIDEPEVEGGPFLLSADFHDSKGQPSLKIVKNEWMAFTSNWDIVIEQRAITIRENLRDVHLKLVYEEPNIIKVEKLRLTSENESIIIENDTLSYFSDGVLIATMKGGVSKDTKGAIYIG